MFEAVTHRLGAVLVIAGLLALGWLLTPLRSERVVLAPQNDSSAFRFGQDRTVGQEFIPPRNVSEIIVTIGSHEDPSGPLLLHLRTDYLGEDLRTAAVFSVEEGSTDLRFTFRPLLNPPPRLLWVLEAPYNPSNMWVYREQDATAFPEGTAWSNDRPLRGNFSFTIVHYELRLQRLWHAWQVDAERWEKQSLLFGLAATAILLTIARRWRSWPLKNEVWWLMAASFIAHLVFIRHFPVINDEGAYIQDVLQSSWSFVPLRDFLTKGPLYLVLLSVWQFLAPHTIFGWRLFSALLWSAAIYFSVALGKELRFSRQTRLLLGAMVALLPASLALTTPLLLQVVAVPVALAALYAVMRGINRNQRSFIIVGACCMTAAYLIRASSAVTALVGLLLILLYSRQRWPMAAWYIATGLLSGGLAWLLLWWFLGWPQVAVAFNIEAMVISQERAEHLGASAEPLLRQLVFEARILWRSAPLLLAGLVLFPLQAIGRRFAAVIGVGAALAPLLFIAEKHWRDMDYLLPPSLPTTQLTVAALVFALPLAWFIVQLAIPTPPKIAQARFPLKRFAVFAVWLVLLVIAYGQWGRFRQSYLVEFIVPLSFITAWSLTVMHAWWRGVNNRKWQYTGLAILLFLISTSLAQGAIIAYQHPHTGNINQASLTEIAAAVRQHVPVGEAIFTAQPTVTAFADRPIMFGYSHPGWYREERFQTVPSALRAVYFMEPALLTEYLQHETHFVLMERRTMEIYFDGYPERREILAEHFHEIARVQNPEIGESFILYKRNAQ